MDATKYEQAAPDALLTIEDMRFLMADNTQWRHRRNGMPFIRIGRKVRYRKSDLEQWFLSNRQNAVEDANYVN